MWKSVLGLFVLFLFKVSWIFSDLHCQPCPLNLSTRDGQLSQNKNQWRIYDRERCPIFKHLEKCKQFSLEFSIACFHIPVIDFCCDTSVRCGLKDLMGQADMTSGRTKLKPTIDVLCPSAYTSKLLRLQLILQSNRLLYLSLSVFSTLAWHFRARVGAYPGKILRKVT